MEGGLGGKGRKMEGREREKNREDEGGTTDVLPPQYLCQVGGYAQSV